MCLPNIKNEMFKLQVTLLLFFNTYKCKFAGHHKTHHMRPLTAIFSIITIALLLHSCVPARKYEEMEAKYKQAESDLASCKTKHEATEKSLADIQTELAELKKSNDKLRSDTAEQGRVIRTQRYLYDKINEQNREIQRQLEFLRKGAEDDSKKLSTEMEALRIQLQRKEDELKTLEKDLDRRKSELEKSEVRVKELEDMLAKKDAAVKALKDKVAEALLSFKDKGLTVEQKNGKVYVSLEAKLLFATMSYNVDKEGKEALIKLAKLLETQTDLEVEVEGHTDTDKIHRTEVPIDNWELSVLRATSVVKLMLANSKMDPKKITAAGKSEFLPVHVTDKAKNRRIEIVLIPNLDELYKILEK